MEGFTNMSETLYQHDRKLKMSMLAVFAAWFSVMLATILLDIYEWLGAMTLDIKRDIVESDNN